MSQRTISTQATARCEAPPESATVEAVATGGGATPGDARAIANDRAATIRESLSAVGSDRIRTADLHVQDTDELFEASSDAQYEATERLHIDCAPGDAEAVVIDITNAGGEVRDVQFQLREATRRALQDEALEEAMARARQKATRMAAAEDAAVGDVQEAWTTDGSDGFESIVDEALAAGADMDLQPAPIEVGASVEVVYDLEEE